MLGNVSDFSKQAKFLSRGLSHLSFAAAIGIWWKGMCILINICYVFTFILHDLTNFRISKPTINWIVNPINCRNVSDSLKQAKFLSRGLSHLSFAAATEILHCVKECDPAISTLINISYTFDL